MKHGPSLLMQCELKVKKIIKTGNPKNWTYGKKWNEPQNIIHKQCFQKKSSKRSTMLRN